MGTAGVASFQVFIQLHTDKYGGGGGVGPRDEAIIKYWWLV